MAPEWSKRIPPSVRPHLRALYRAWLTNPLRTRGARSRLLKELEGQEGPDSTLLRRVDTVISPEDNMWLAGHDRYFRVGLDAIRCIDRACAVTGSSSPRRILDMPCGAGRVMRFIVLRFPAAELTACDLLDDAVDFCAKRYGARPVVSTPDFDRLELPGAFDLIWSGSLVSHLNAQGTEAFLRLCRRAVAPSGIAVVTTHGSEVSDRVRRDPAFYDLEAEQAGTVVAHYEADGCAFVPYCDPHEPEMAGYTQETAPWGISLMSREWMRDAAKRAGLREVYFAEHDWNAHQDVFAFAATG